MRARAFDPLKLDVEAFAREGGELQGEWPAAALARLAESGAPEAPAQGWPEVHWSARGEQRPVRAGEPETWLHLEADAEVALTCQRCLQPVRLPVSSERSFRFVRDEARAAELDMDSEDEVLALTRSLDLRELVEDELLLELPVVPRHEVCPQPLRVPEDDVSQEEVEPERPNPFAALAALKKGSASQS